MNNNPFPIPKKVILMVVGFHVLVCSFFFFSNPSQNTRSVHVPIQAKHYTLEKELPKAAPAAKPHKRASETRTLKKTSLKKEPAKKENHLAKKQERAKPKPLKEPTVSSLKPETKKPSPTQASAIQKTTSETKVSSNTTPHQLTYSDQLGQLLKSKVSLKNSGFVRIKLKLSSKGELMNLDVIGASDSEFISPVQEQIKALDFPPFDATIKNKKSEVFTFEFSAD